MPLNNVIVYFLVFIDVGTSQLQWKWLIVNFTYWQGAPREGGSRCTPHPAHWCARNLLKFRGSEFSGCRQSDFVSCISMLRMGRLVHYFYVLCLYFTSPYWPLLPKVNNCDFGDHQKLSKIGKGYSVKSNFCSIDRRDINLFLFNSYGPQEVNKRKAKNSSRLG